MTLAKGLEILAAYASAGSAMTNAEVAELTGVPRPTVARLTATLVDLGYLVRAGRGRFEVGGRALTLGHPVVSRLIDRQKARPLMREFAGRSGGAVSIAVASDMDYVFVESVRVGDFSSHVPEVGFSAPLATTAMGRALLSCMTDERLKQYQQRVRNFRPDEWRLNRDAIGEAIEACRRDGFCAVFGTWRPEVFALASPLGLTTHGEVLAVNCGIPSWLMTPQQIHDAQLGQRLAALASSIRAVMPLLAGIPETHAQKQSRGASAGSKQTKV